MKIETFNFDRIIERRGTDSLKWHKFNNQDVLPMWVADMDFASPPCVIEALRERIDHGVFGYAVHTDELNASAVNWMRKRYDWHIETDWIVWLPGLVSALHVTCLACAAPGEQIATFVPVYPPFLSAPRHTDRELLSVPLKRENGRYTFDIEALDNAITPETRVLILCHPHNPVGRAFEKPELFALNNMLLRHERLTICSDEIHCDLILDEKDHTPFVSLDPALQNRTITLMSPAKTFNIAGLNCGMAIIPDQDLRRRFQHSMEGIVPHPNTLGYTACRAAYSEGEPWRQALIAYLRQNRDILESFVKDHLPMLQIDHIEATYLAWLNVEQLYPSRPARLFREAGVGLIDGKLFGDNGHVRLNFGCPQSRLLQALERMEKAVKQTL